MIYYEEKPTTDILRMIIGGTLNRKKVFIPLGIDAIRMGDEVWRAPTDGRRVFALETVEMTPRIGAEVDLKNNGIDFYFRTRVSIELLNSLDNPDRYIEATLSNALGSLATLMKEKMERPIK